MAINSRTKGAGGEREFAGLVFDHLGVKMERNLVQTRSGGYDLLVNPEEQGPVADTLRTLAIETKRYARITDAKLQGFWQQAVSQAADAGKHPVLAFREDRQPWRVTIPIGVIQADFTQSLELAYTVTMSVEGFAHTVREVSRG